MLIFLFILLFDPAGGTIQSRIREVTAKSVYRADTTQLHRVEHTVDGDLKTAWISETDNKPEWLKLALVVEGSRVEKVVIVSR